MGARLHVHSPVSPPPSPKVPEKDYVLPISSKEVAPFKSTKWADGLRGISSIFVMSSHMVLSFDRSLLLPRTEANGPTRLFQRPVLRLISQGSAFVAIFFILLGYVNSLKVIKLSRQGKVNEALNSLTTASFRRTGRLVFPATLVTVLAWFATQLGAFELSRRSDSYWLSTTSPLPSANWDLAIRDLFHELVETWVRGENRYDQPQWALLRLFQGSMYVFMFLLVTVRVTPAARMISLVVLWFWSWGISDALVGPNVFAGIFLAELTYIELPFSSFSTDDNKNSISLPTSLIATRTTFLQKALSKVRNQNLLSIFPFLLVPPSLLLMSYPGAFPELSPWSASLLNLGVHVFPSNHQIIGEAPNTTMLVFPALDLGRAWPAIGAQTFCTSILFSDALRQVFSSAPLLWLGGVSYTIYLLHGPMMRGLLAWMVLAPGAALVTTQSEEMTQTEVGDEVMVVKVPENGLWIIGMIVVWGVVFVLVVKVWAKGIEPWFAKATAGLEALCLRGQTASEAGLQKRRENQRVDVGGEK